MKLAIFGGTGTVGTVMVELALEAGHQVRLLARTPAKIGRVRDTLNVLSGDAKDPGAVAATVTGCDAVMRALGGFADSDSIRIGTSNIITAMRDAGIKPHCDRAGLPPRFSRRPGQSRSTHDPAAALAREPFPDQ